MNALTVIPILSSGRFRLSSEKATQSDIEEHLRAHDVLFVREARLSSADIPDFVVGKTAIEVKLRGSKLAIFRQLERYAKYDTINEIVLVTNVAMGLPTEILGKPVHMVNLARAWL